MCLYVFICVHHSCSSSSNANTADCAGVDAYRDQGGRTALLIAAWNGCTQVVGVLADAKVCMCMCIKISMCVYTVNARV
jgi:hypothetical protein